MGFDGFRGKMLQYQGVGVEPDRGVSQNQSENMYLLPGDTYTYAKLTICGGNLDRSIFNAFSLMNPRNLDFVPKKFAATTAHLPQTKSGEHGAKFLVPGN